MVEKEVFFALQGVALTGNKLNGLTEVYYKVGLAIP
jgi:hypothetical protein